MFYQKWAIIKIFGQTNVVMTENGIPFQMTVQIFLPMILVCGEVSDFCINIVGLTAKKH
jgi:hypothetical protein